MAGDDVHLAYVEDEHVPAVDGDGDLSARITLRLSESLKTRVEEGAAGEGISVNTYIVRTLERGHIDQPEPKRAGRKPPARLRHDLKGATDMEKTFETPGAVRSTWRTRSGLVAITAAPDPIRPIVSLEADTPGAEELVERAAVECRSIPDGHVVAVKVSRRNGMRFVRRNAVIVRVELPEESDGQGAGRLGRRRDHRARRQRSMSARRAATSPPTTWPPT